ncbi:hypothetical protein GTQ34_11950 [Muricauda sp. JGD-17]|uniref:Fibronectin type-III domain-containing protein n=1 Tax=Flagellimonas ochracea TaxID=2696472 RepID=A0A964WY80_9FLAO|nr:hypothetical protein [Allomuricauda ochracea]NAY92632.1 hypothetical protein [Allomuricauda ochracea]
MKKYLFPLLTLLLLASCGGNDDPPPAPGGASLVFPEENSECTTGTSVNENLSQVTFEWSASTNTDSYTLSAVNLDTNVPQTISTAATSASLSIAKGTPFSWSVTSRNSKSEQVASSETWLFYNAGTQTSYAPFPAQLVSPISGSTVQKDIANEVLLRWSGADVDNDIDAFQIFFSDQNPPQTEAGSTSASVMELAVSVTSNTVYYWRVITTDSQGNTSDSGVFEFKVF